MKTTNTSDPNKDNVIYCDYVDPRTGATVYDTPFKEVPSGARITARTMNGKPIESVNPNPFIKP